MNESICDYFCNNVHHNQNEFLSQFFINLYLNDFEINFLNLDVHLFAYLKAKLSDSKYLPDGYM